MKNILTYSITELSQNSADIYIQVLRRFFITLGTQKHVEQVLSDRASAESVHDFLDFLWVPENGGVQGILGSKLSDQIKKLVISKHKDSGFPGAQF